MSIAIPRRLAAGFCRRVPAVALGLWLPAALLGGCSQRMALKVNGQTVTQDQFYQRCANFTQGQLAPPVGLIAMDQAIRELLLNQEAKRLNLEPTDAEVNTELDNIRKQMATGGQSLDQRLKQMGLPLDTIKNQIRLDVLQRKLITNGVTVTDKDVEQYYNQNKQSPQFTTPKQVNAEQITVPTEAAAKEVEQTLSKNAAFDLVAHSKSIDQYKDQGGRLPTLQQGYPVPPGVSPVVFAEAFKLPVGKPSAPIKVGNDWVILKIIDEKPQNTRTLAEAKDEIRQMLLMQKAQQSGLLQKFQQRMMELQRDADIQVGVDQFRAPILDQQKALKQAPAPGLTPVLPGGR
jgi:foldase protein PrsA